MLGAETNLPSPELKISAEFRTHGIAGPGNTMSGTSRVLTPPTSRTLSMAKAAAANWSRRSFIGAIGMKRCSAAS